MEITLLQGILLTIMTIIVGLDFFLEAFFIFRPLIVSTLTGLILGDITLGLKVGALIELAFAGLTPAGGTQPPNPVFAGLMGTVCHSVLLFRFLILYGKSRQVCCRG